MITKRLKNITHIPEQSLVENPPIPRSVKIELSSKCNYRCQFCCINDRLHQAKNMEWDLFVMIVNELSEIGVEEIGLFMIGEPFISPNLLVNAITYLKKDLNFPYVFITSNGALANPEMVQKCMKAGLDSLKWSCNTANDEQFEELTRVKKKSFDLMKNNIKSAFEIRNSNNYKTKLYASSIRYDNKQLELMKPFLNEFVLPYVDEHYWLPLYSMGGYATEREAELGYIPIAGNSGRYDDPVDPIPCWSLFTAGHILFDGGVTACCADGTGKWVVGNIKNEKFKDIWLSKEFCELRKSHLLGNIVNTKCENCALF